MKSCIDKIRDKIFPRKSLSFFDLPCELTNDLFEMRARQSCLESGSLFGRLISSVSIKSIFGLVFSVELSFDFYDENFREQINCMITENMGKPKYYDDLGRKIWSCDGITVRSGEKEVGYNVVIQSVTVFFYPPFIRKYPHERIDLLRKSADNIAAEWGIRKYSSNVSRGNLSLMHFETENYNYSFTLVGRKLKMRAFKKELTHGIECGDYYTYRLDWSEDVTIRRRFPIEGYADSFFVYMEEYDSGLKRRYYEN